MLMRLATSFLAFALTVPAFGATWVVDSSGGGDFTTIQAAINNVAAGDVLLVRAGNYSGFTLIKDLSILGDPLALPNVNGSGTLVVSGAALSPPAVSPSLSLTQPVPPQPFIDLINSDLPNGNVRLNIYGPSGNVQWILSSFVPAQGSLFGVQGTLWLDAFQTILTFPVVTKGQGLSENFLFQLPPSLAGFEGAMVTFQGFATDLGAGGTYFATNPAHLLIRR